MTSYLGVTCSGNASFYFCNDTDSFVGCCITNPCNGAGCLWKDLQPAAFNLDIWDIPTQGCLDEKGVDVEKWHKCDASNRQGRFMGCCSSSPCEKNNCPEGDVLKMKFASGENDRSAFTAKLAANRSPTSTTSTMESVTTGGPSTPTGSAITSATPSSKPSGTDSDPSEPAQRLPAGSVAGIAIGCVAAGLLLGALAAFVLFRRRKQRKPQPEYVQMPYVPGKEKDLPGVPAGATGDVRLGHFLLTPKPDNEITTELGSLGALIQQHVENNYHQKPVRQSSEQLAHALMTLGLAGAGRRSPEALVRLALDTRTRSAALQHVITRVAFDSAGLAPPGSGSPGPAVSLLPPAVAAFASSVPATERHRGNAEAVATAMTKWRQLSAFLLHPNRSDRTPLTPPEEATAQQAQQLAVELNQFLEPFALRDRERNSEQEKHLRQVLAECARFGYLLFSQPFEYRFDFDDRGRLAGIVVCPGLERVSDDEGRTYSTPQVLAAPVEIA